MKSFFSSLLTAVTLVLVSAGLSFGQTVTVWPLESSTADSVTSNVAAASEVVTGLSTGYEVPAAGTTNNVQKVKPDASTSDATNGTGTWPVETALNAARYVQFVLTPQTGYSVTLDSISMMIGAKGIKGMNAEVQYSMHSDFSSPTTVSSMGDLIENAVKDTTLSVSVSLSSGDTVYVRVYPWIPAGSGTSTGKYLYLGAVTPYGSVWTTPMASNGMWDFQADSLGDSTSHMGWGSYDLNSSIADDPLNPGKGNHVLESVIKNYNAAPVIMAVLPAGKSLSDYQSFDFAGYFAKGDVGYKTIYVQAYSSLPSGPFAHGADTNNTIGSVYRSKSASTGWENWSIPIKGSISMTDTVYFAFGISASGSGGTTWYADSIQLVPYTTTASKVTKWGYVDNFASGWKLSFSSTGDTVTSSGTAEPTNWMAIRGEFLRPLTPTTATDGALVVTGKIKFVGEGPDGWSVLRYGLYRNDSAGTLLHPQTDSAKWSGEAYNYSSGYEFSPQSGTAMAGNGLYWGGVNNGATQGLMINGKWFSTYSSVEMGLGGMIQQAPARAAMNAGTYDFAFSVHPLANGSKKVNFYLIQEGNPVPYWYGGSVIDTSSLSSVLNAVCFAVNNNTTNGKMTGVVVSNVVDSLGPDITIPAPPWQAYYIDQSSFAFYGNRMGGWSLIPGGGYGLNSVTGNVTLWGDTSVPQYQSMAVRGAFVDEVAPRGPDSNVVVSGDLDFLGGGFSTPNSFLFGIFNSDSAGTINKSDTTHYAWTGSEDYNNGYLFIPPSGSATKPQWPGGVTSQYLNGDVGAVVNGVWLSTVNSKNYMLASTDPYPSAAIPHRGMYHFRITVGPNVHGQQQVSYMLYEKPDTSYVFQGKFTDTHSPVTASQFNSVAFALLGGNSTDTLKIENVRVNLGPPDTLFVLTGVTNTVSNLPKSFALYQNYPNPFNPTTVISYALPKASHVMVKVYNVLGQAVATVVDSKQTAGIYKVNFNMDKYASGVYFVRMTAGNFVHTEKMMLLK